MDRWSPVQGPEADVRRGAGARRAMRERQKRELRSERDRIVLELARSFGTAGLAERLGTSAGTTSTLVERARGRVEAAPRRISARRFARDPERWAEADRHFESLGRSVRLPVAPPRRD